MRRPSPALVVAFLALIVALGGTSYAVAKLPKNSVGTKQLKNNSVTGAKVKDGSLVAGDFKAGQLPAGPAGPQGAQGEPGTALAYAQVDSNGGAPATLVAARTSGITEVTRANTGVYCLAVDPSIRERAFYTSGENAGQPRRAIVAAPERNGTSVSPIIEVAGPHLQCPEYRYEVWTFNGADDKQSGAVSFNAIIP